MGSPVALRSHEMHEHLQFCARTKEPGPPADERGLCSSEVVLQAAGRAPLPANRQVTFSTITRQKVGFTTSYQTRRFWVMQSRLGQLILCYLKYEDVHTSLGFLVHCPAGLGNFPLAEELKRLGATQIFQPLTHVRQSTAVAPR